MLEISVIRESKDEIIKRLQKRGLDGEGLLSEVIDIDKKRREAQLVLDGQLSESNKLSKEIGLLFKNGEQSKANELKARVSEIKEGNIALKNNLVNLEEQLNEKLYHIPNAPHPDVPIGTTEEDNEIIYEEGIKPELPNGHIPHWELASKYNLIDFELGAKVTGAGFPFYIGKGARLQRALINFFLDEAINAGYLEVLPPHLVNEDSGIGTGQLPDKDGQMYHAKEDNLYLIPTAEVPITNIYRGTILKEEDFPKKMVGYTPCFRREAGSYGKDVRGLNRLHQFDKVEIVQVAHPDNSFKVLDEMVNHVKGLLNKLGLPYRIAKLCAGDLGFAASITYDMEVFSASQERWLEVSSISNFESFQANRLKLRFKNKQGKTQLCHTLNGSALALPRILASILENYQTENGIKIPEVLQPYCGFEIIN